MNQIVTFKLVSSALVLLMTLLAGAYPFIKKIRTNHGHEFPIGEALASGVFLGAGLVHMLADASKDFVEQGFNYPYASMLAGVAFLLLLLFEHIGREIYEHSAEDSPSFAILAVVMLSIHSFLAGAALGLSQSLAMMLVILMAILAHKWAASFALAIEINKSCLPVRSGLLLFSVFAVMAPLGIIMGQVVTAGLAKLSVLEPIFSALAAGTFLYLGTLHGLKRAVMVDKCCDLKRFNFVLFGFAIMAFVAVWT